jgi:hypothetical protein
VSLRAWVAQSAAGPVAGQACPAGLLGPAPDEIRPKTRQNNNTPQFISTDDFPARIV